MSGDPRADIRRFAGWALVGGLSVAALTAVVALVVGDFDDTEVRVILTSIGFALASSTGAAGAAQRLRASERLRALGTVTAGASAIAFVLLVAGLWTDDWGTEGIWRAFGCAGVIAVAGAHTCLVLGARRATDSEVVRLLVIASLVLAVVDTVGALLPISGLMDDVDEAGAQLLAAALVLLVLSTVLPPILRRLQPGTAPAASSAGYAAGSDGATVPRSSAGYAGHPSSGSPAPSAAGSTALTAAGAGPRAGTGGPREEALAFLAEEVETIAIRIEQLSRGTAISAPDIRREAERLRDLARSFQS